MAKKPALGTREFVDHFVEMNEKRLAEVLQEKLTAIDPTIDWSKVTWDISLKNARIASITDDDETDAKIKAATQVLKSRESPSIDI